MDATLQIAQAEQRIRSVIGDTASTALLAYPDGKRNDFLVEEYLPNQSLIRAAFTTDGQTVTIDASRWQIQRYTCGDHWKTSEDFDALVQSWIQIQ